MRWVGTAGRRCSATCQAMASPSRARGGGGGQVNGRGALGCLLEIRKRLGLSFNDDVLRLEPLVDVHTELASGEISDMPDGCLHVVSGPQILADGLSLGGRLDDDQRGPLAAAPCLRL